MTVAIPRFSVKVKGDWSVIVDFDPPGFEDDPNPSSQWRDLDAAEAQLTPLLRSRVQRFMGERVTPTLIEAVTAEVHQLLVQLVKDSRLWWTGDAWEIGARI